MTWRRRAPLLVGLGGALALIAAGWVIPVQVRHSAPFGFSKTIDFGRRIAVNGGYVTANYPDFDRLDLDLRGYTKGITYDLTVHVRPAAPGAPDVRTLSLDLRSDRVAHVKKPFANPFRTLYFPPIRDSAGRTYYVWIETGPRNRDDVIALWSIKSYSRQPAWAVVRAFLRYAPSGQAAGAIRVALILLLAVLVTTVGWLLSAIARALLTGAPRGLRPDPTRWRRRKTDGIQ